MNNALTTMRGDLKSFDFHGMPIRLVRDGHGEPWFVAADIAKALDHSNASAMCAVCKEKHRSNLSLDRGGTVLVISEPGLNKVLMRSNKPAAEPFQDWLAEEVLPAIRRTEVGS